MPINISTRTGVFRWRPACWIRATGDDAANFLQGQFSNDLRLLQSSGGVYGLWLNLKGKVLADSFVLRGEGATEYWIGSYFSRAAIIRERLESHVIADDVVLEDVSAGWSAVSVVGDELVAGIETSRSADCLVFRGRRSLGRSVECVYRDADALPTAIKRTLETARALTEDDMARLRITAGIPAIGVDVGSGDLPNEAGLEAEAISYTKGCYLGQEVMARLKSMGQVRRRLLRVRGADPRVPVLPSPVFSSTRPIGDVRSAVTDGTGGWIGLAMLSLLHLGAGENLSLAVDGSSPVRSIEP